MVENELLNNPLAGNTQQSLGNYPMPEELEGQVSQENWNAFVETMDGINSSYDEAYAGIDQDALQEEMQTGISGLGGSMGLSDEEYEQLMAMAEAQGVPVVDGRNSAVSQAGQLQSGYRDDVRAAMQEFGIPESVERNGRIFYLDYGIDNRMGLSIYDRDAEGIGSGKSFTYSIDHKDNDQGGFDLLSTAAMIGVGLMTGGALSGALESTLSLTTAQAAAAASAITNSAIQLASTGSLDLKQALIAAGTSYFTSGGMTELADKFGISVEGGAFDTVINTVNDGVDTFKEAISTGSSIADAAIQAGGTDALLQLVSTGDVDPAQALTAAASAGLQDAFTQVVSGVASGMEEDEFYQWLEQDAELQSAIDTANEQGWFPDLDNSGDFSVGDLEVTVENTEIPQSEIDAVLNPDMGTTEALTLQDGTTYYVTEDGSVFDSSQVSWNQEIDGYAIKGTTTPVSEAKYDANTDRFYDPETLDVVLRGEDSALMGATGEEFTYGNESGGNTIFESVSPAPTDMGSAQYSGTLKSVDGDLDVYYDPTTNTEFVYNPDDPTKVQYLTEEQQQEVTRENTTEDSADSTPTSSNESQQQGGTATGGTDGSPNNAPENVTSESSSGATGGQDNAESVVIVSPPSTTTDVNDVEVTVGDTASTPVGGTDAAETIDNGNANNVGTIGGMITGMGSNVGNTANGGQNSTTDGNTGTTDGSNAGNDNGNTNNIGVIGDMITGIGGTVAGTGADNDGSGDEGVDDGTGGTGGDGGDGGGSGGMLSGNDNPEWTDLFPYTTVTGYQAKALAPYKDYIAKARGMLS